MMKICFILIHIVLSCLDFDCKAATKSSNSKIIVCCVDFLLVHGLFVHLIQAKRNGEVVCSYSFRVSASVSANAVLKEQNCVINFDGLTIKVIIR